MHAYHLSHTLQMQINGQIIISHPIRLWFCVGMFLLQSPYIFIPSTDWHTLTQMPFQQTKATKFTVSLFTKRAPNTQIIINIVIKLSRASFPYWILPLSLFPSNKHCRHTSGKVGVECRKDRRLVSFSCDRKLTSVINNNKNRHAIVIKCQNHLSIERISGISVCHTIYTYHILAEVRWQIKHAKPVGVGYIPYNIA